MPAASLRPHRPIRPGELLQEELEARGWTQADLAQILGRPVQAINEIIAGKKAITAETAVALSRALEAPAEYWLKLDALYRLDLLHQRRPLPEEDITRRARVYTAAPVKELLKRRWLTVADPQDPGQLERAVCKFYG
ncbi:MAG TPA: HigA family addiction module antitoxin, partial [Coriobacteriia bacterium]